MEMQKPYILITTSLTKKGNWIRQKKMQDGKVIEIKVRDIKYY